MPVDVDPSDLIKSTRLGLNNIRELEKHDNSLNRFVKDQSWDKVATQRQKADVFFVVGP